MKAYRGLLGPILVVLIALAAMRWSPLEPHREASDEVSPDVVAEPTWPDEDWVVFQSRVSLALEQRLDTLPFGRTMAEIGRSLVGTPYVPRTLEVDGPERVVINFQGLDCVTFVENVFAMAAFVHGSGGHPYVFADRGAAERRYARFVESLRYRGGELSGYPSRLHYFSDWIADHADRGLVVDLGEGLGGVVDTEPVDFMSTHPDAYRQLADADVLEAIRATEQALNARPRRYVPEGQIPSIAAAIQDGDIIAATSTVGGLDVAHTGLALWVDGALHLMHAPLVGEAVQISEVPLADRILTISGQDGIMVARPLPTLAGSN